MTLLKPRYKRVAVIGGGPCGLAALKALSLEPAKFERIELLERRDNVGGLWYYGGDKSKAHPHIPSLDPNTSDLSDCSTNQDSHFFSPMYAHLETNLISRMMEYSDVHFSDQTPTFPNREVVLNYVRSYADTIPSSNTSIQCNANVTNITKTGNIWNLIILNTQDLSTSTKEYDALVIANGHFDVPYIPDIEGLSNWNLRSPRSITHARYFDTSTPYKNQNVLVVGNFASGVDISIQLSVSAKNVYVSVKDLDNLSPVENQASKFIGLIEKYDYEDHKSVTTIQGDKISDIDSIIFCTGYLYSTPFLTNYLPRLITDGYQINDVYKQMFYIPDPSLSFVALPKNVIPMPVSESQGSVIARYYSGRFSLPSKQVMSEDYQLEVERKGSGKAFHNLKFPADVEYCNELLSWIKRDDLDKEGLIPPIWDEQRVSDREHTGEFKGKRLVRIVEHANKLRQNGEEFRLLSD